MQHKQKQIHTMVLHKHQKYLWQRRPLFDSCAALLVRKWATNGHCHFPAHEVYLISLFALFLRDLEDLYLSA